MTTATIINNALVASDYTPIDVVAAQLIGGDEQSGGLEFTVTFLEDGERQEIAVWLYPSDEGFIAEL